MTAPSYGMSIHSLLDLLEHVPHFHLVFLGPWDKTKKGATQERLRLKADYVTAPGLEAATDAAMYFIEQYCLANDCPFDSDQWTLIEVTRCNCN